MNDLDRDYINTSQTLVDRFVEFEFSRLDTDGSGGLDLKEFIAYVDTMTTWMRSQVHADSSVRTPRSRRVATPTSLRAQSCAPVALGTIPPGADRPLIRAPVRPP